MNGFRKNGTAEQTYCFEAGRRGTATLFFEDGGIIEREFEILEGARTELLFDARERTYFQGIVTVQGTLSRP